MKKPKSASKNPSPAARSDGSGGNGTTPKALSRAGRLYWNLANTVREVIRTDLGVNVRGQIDPPSYAQGLVKISSNLKDDRQALEVVVHEGLHGALWMASEEWIERTAIELSDLLYLLGARIDLSLIPEKPPTYLPERRPRKRKRQGVAQSSSTSKRVGRGKGGSR